MYEFTPINILDDQSLASDDASAHNSLSRNDALIPQTTDSRYDFSPETSYKRKQSRCVEEPRSKVQIAKPRRGSCSDALQAGFATTDGDAAKEMLSIDKKQGFKLTKSFYIDQDRGPAHFSELKPIPDDRGSQDHVDYDHYSQDLLSQFASSLPFQSVVSDAGDQNHLLQSHRDRVAFPQGNDIGPLPSPTVEEIESREQLSDTIAKSMVKTSVRTDGKMNSQFIPKSTLWRILNPTSVERELSRIFRDTRTSQEIERLVNAVCGETEILREGRKKIKTFRKIFALLVILNAVASISLLLEDDASDLDLPLLYYKDTYQLCRRKDPKQPIKCFERWNTFSRVHFEQDQWMVLAPFFSQDDDGDIKHYQLQEKHIVPFVAPNGHIGRRSNKIGGYGQVFMVHIHPEHHNFKEQKQCERGFAVKRQLHENYRNVFKKEIMILKKFSGVRSHKHIVSLLATYQQSDMFHLIFYRAEGSLFDFWNDIVPQPRMCYQNILWMASQCAGIAEGLLKLHRHLTVPIRTLSTSEWSEHQSTGDRHVSFVNLRHGRARTDSIKSTGSVERDASPIAGLEDEIWVEGCSKLSGKDQRSDGNEHIKYGRHGDINPANLLWFADGVHSKAEHDLSGTIKISDFGQAELSSWQSKTKPRSVATTVTYRPPESDLKPGVIRQNCDLWCLGCVYLEFITWLLGGKDLLSQFARKRLATENFQSYFRNDTFYDK